MDIRNKLIKLGLYFNSVIYDDINKVFSPAWDKKKYEKALVGFSTEFCHNLYRLIMRPDVDSAQHWFTEALAWFEISLNAKIPFKTRPIHLLFAEILDENTSRFPLAHCSECMYDRVYKEMNYGPVINDDIDYVNQKITELYKMIDPKKTYSNEEADNLLYKWYRSIDDATEFDIIRVIRHGKRGKK